MTTAELRDRLQEELAIAIAQHRTGQGAGKMTREILKRERRSYFLVGLTMNGEFVGFFDLLTHDVKLVPFDETGLDGLGSEHVD